MNQSSPTNVDPQADDGLDRLLREYFKTQVPRQFPPLPMGVVEPVPMARIQQPSPLSRGRWVLAVCVAVVLIGFGLLLQTQSNGSMSAGPGFSPNGTAGGTNPMPPKKAP
jgi:hypothetical protein